MGGRQQTNVNGYLKRAVSGRQLKRNEKKMFDLIKPYDSLIKKVFFGGGEE
jgi:hypothetical protein